MMSNQRACFSLSFDALSLLISAADIITDVLIARDFYDRDHMAFFWASAVYKPHSFCFCFCFYLHCILAHTMLQTKKCKNKKVSLVLAQMAYTVAFIIVFAEHKTNWQKTLLFFIVFPIAPLQCFILFFAAQPNSWCVFTFIIVFFFVFFYLFIFFVAKLRNTYKQIKIIYCFLFYE